MSYNAINSHGTFLQLGGPVTGSANYQTIAEVGPFKTPKRSLTMHEWTAQEDDDDAFIAGKIKRKESIPLQIAYRETHPTHDVNTGLASFIDGANKGVRAYFRILFQSGTQHTFEGYVESFQEDLPVDGILLADVSIKPSGPYTIGS